MAKRRKTPSLNIHDFFGAYNTYRIFALKSELSTFPFVNQFGQAANLTFTLLADIEQSVKDFSAHYSVFYTELSQQKPIHCLLLENKAVIDQQQQFVSKTEKNLHFQTGFLFEEWLYIFNNQGLRCFDVEFPDIDYLLLIFAKKNVENETFKQFLKYFAPFNAQDISHLLENEQTSNGVKIVDFLRDFFCKYEVKANQFSLRRKMDLLSPIKQIQGKNLQFRIPALLENESLADNFQLSDEYLAFLTEE
jgi:sulfur relay (sulfurtransferase) DsrC/TusE family protein